MDYLIQKRLSEREEMKTRGNEGNTVVRGEINRAGEG